MDSDNSIEEISLKSDQSQIIINYKLEKNHKSTSYIEIPGRIFSKDSEKNSSSEEFDVEIFRKSNFQEKNNLNFQDQPKIATFEKYKNDQKIKFLGIEFDIAILQERNKDVILFLKTIFFWVIFLNVLFWLTFVVGLNFKLILVILCSCLSVASFTFVILSCKFPIKNGLKLSPFLIVICMLYAFLLMILFMYCLIVKIPYNSLFVFIFLIYSTLVVNCFVGALDFFPNFCSHDDPNYQLKFFVERAIKGFFNGTGGLDSLSDVVLGVQLITYPQKKFLIIGIFLLILCNVDYLWVIKKTVAPNIFNIRDSVFVVLVEIVVLLLGTIVLVDVLEISDDENGDNAFIASVVSISTSVINILHNSFLLYVKIRANSVEPL